MRRNKKAQLKHVFPWLLYIPLTAAIVFVILYIPVVVLGGAAKTQQLENVVFSDRIYNKMSIYDDLIFRLYPGHTCTSGCFDQKFINDSFDTSGSSRGIGFKLTFNKNSIFFNKDFYDDAKPLAPVRYDEFLEVRPIIVIDTGSVDKLFIDQVYSGRLEQFE